MKGQKCSGPSLYPVTGCHVIRSLNRNIDLKKKKKEVPFSFPLSQVYFIFTFQLLKSLLIFQANSILGTYYIVSHRQMFITPEWRLAADSSHSLVSPPAQTNKSISAYRMQAKKISYLIFLPGSPSIMELAVLGGWDTFRFSAIS